MISSFSMTLPSAGEMYCCLTRTPCRESSMLKRTCSDEAAVYNFTGIETSPNEMTPEAIARAAMALSHLPNVHGVPRKAVLETCCDCVEQTWIHFISTAVALRDPRNVVFSSVIGSRRGRRLPFAQLSGIVACRIWKAEEFGEC